METVKNNRYVAGPLIAQNRFRQPEKRGAVHSSIEDSALTHQHSDSASEIQIDPADTHFDYRTPHPDGELEIETPGPKVKSITRVLGSNKYGANVAIPFLVVIDHRRAQMCGGVKTPRGAPTANRHWPGGVTTSVRRGNETIQIGE